VPRKALTGAKNAQKTLLAGFTTVRNVGADGYTDIALRDAINDGEILGPRMFVSGPPLGITGGHCDDNLLAPEYHYVAEGVADGPWAARTKVRQAIKYGADVIKSAPPAAFFPRATRPARRSIAPRRCAPSWKRRTGWDARSPPTPTARSRSGSHPGRRRQRRALQPHRRRGHPPGQAERHLPGLRYL